MTRKIRNRWKRQQSRRLPIQTSPQAQTMTHLSSKSKWLRMTMPSCLCFLRRRWKWRRSTRCWWKHARREFRTSRRSWRCWKRPRRRRRRSFARRQHPRSARLRVLKTAQSWSISSSGFVEKPSLWKCPIPSPRESFVSDWWNCWTWSPQDQV